jgi:hypothetical protein
MLINRHVARTLCETRDAPLVQYAAMVDARKRWMSYAVWEDFVLPDFRRYTGLQPRERIAFANTARL